MNTANTVSIVAIVLSALSLVLAGLSLGWNVYRDVILKARVKVELSVAKIVNLSEGRRRPATIALSVTNLGPGALIVGVVHVRYAPLWRRLTRRTVQGYVRHDFMDPLNHKMPKKLEEGEKVDILFPYKESPFLGKPLTHVGVADTFGRHHWAPRSQLTRACAQYKADFRDGSGPSDDSAYQTLMIN